jgi:hypothetical protein
VTSKEKVRTGRVTARANSQRGTEGRDYCCSRRLGRIPSQEALINLYELRQGNRRCPERGQPESLAGRRALEVRARHSRCACLPAERRYCLVTAPRCRGGSCRGTLTTMTAGISSSLRWLG